MCKFRENVILIVQAYASSKLHFLIYMFFEVVLTLSNLRDSWKRCRPTHWKRMPTCARVSTYTGASRPYTGASKRRLPFHVGLTTHHEKTHYGIIALACNNNSTLMLSLLSRTLLHASLARDC